MLRLTRHGFREMLIGTVVLAVVAVVLGLQFWPLALIVVPVLVWLFAFFRDPERTLPDEQHAMVSPADGKVSDITEVEDDELLGGPAVRVGIFLSVFNVHVNRAPCDGRVLSVTYKRGQGSKPEGTLVPGASVKVKEGMVFNVSETGQS